MIPHPAVDLGPVVPELILVGTAILLLLGGATLRRTESLNTSPTFISALAEIVRARL